MPKFDPITGKQIVSEGTISPEGVIHAPFIPPDTERITPSAVSPAVPLDVSVLSVQPPTTSAAIVAGAEQTAQDIAKRAEIQKQAELAVPPETELSKQIKALTTQATGLLTETGGRGAEQLRREQELGVPGLSTQLADLNSQILTKLAEHKAIQAKYAQAITGIEAKPISMARAAGQQTQLERQQMAELNRNASEIGLLQAQSQGALGQLQAAQASANRAVDLKYQSITDELNIKLKQLDLLYPQLEREEKRWADTLKIRYQREQQETEDEKSKEKQLTNYALTQMNTYKSAGINIEDSYETIQNKVLQSAEYLEKRQPKLETIGTSETGYYSFNPITGETKKLVGAGIPPPTPTEITGIDELARALNAGTIKLSNVPEKLRTQVMSKSKDFALEDLKGDILMAKDKNDYGTREQLLGNLKNLYTEFSKDEIARWVYELIPDQPAQPEIKSFWQRLFSF